MLVKGPILALDLATNTGFAFGVPGIKTPRSGRMSLPDRGAQLGTFALAFEDWLGPILDKGAPELVIFEAPILHRKNALLVVRKLTGLCWSTEVMCKRRGILCREVNNLELKRFFAGHGWAQKYETIDVCRRYGWDPESDDEADALSIWALACFFYGGPAAASRFALGPLGAS